MFEKFSQSARRSLFFARYESSACGDRRIEPHHVLLGLLREGHETTQQLFAAFSVDTFALRNLWPARVERISSSAELPLTEDGKKVLAYAAHVAEGFSSAEVDPIHLLIGILHVPESAAAKALQEAGMSRGPAIETAKKLAADFEAHRKAHERTPIILRESHYEVIDRIREGLVTPVSREEVVLAIMDGVCADPNSFSAFESVDELRLRVAEAIRRLG